VRKNILVIMIVVPFTLVMGGCLSSAQTKAYLEGIPVTTPGLSDKADGVYKGTYAIVIPPGGIAFYQSMSVEVAVKDGRIAAVAITDPQELNKDEVYDVLVAGPNGIISRQTLDVDAVSGASYSSKILLKAVENTLSPKESGLGKYESY
jgi:uncharacterized protein with FMN-binding domain